MPPHDQAIQGPLHPTPAEYPAFLKFLSQCYRFTDPRWFEKDAPFFFGPKPSQLRTKWVLKIGDRFASHVGIFPFTAWIEGRPLKVAGIGAVATHPDFRGQGLMKRLMDHFEREIEKERYDLSILWGERGLYQPYGYERGLFLDQFSFSKRHLDYFAAPGKVRPADSKDLSALQKLYAAHPFRVQRDRAYTVSLFSRFNRPSEKPVWVLEERGKVVAYSAFWRPASFWKKNLGPLDVAEWGGATEDVVCLWASVLRQGKAEALTATLYPGCGLFDWALENCSNQVQTTQSFMVKVLNLSKVLKTFEPQLQRRYGALGVNARKTFTLRVENGQAVSLELGAKLRIRPAVASGIPITLSPVDCNRVLFGAGTGGRGLLDSLFPLKWYWWRSDWI